MPKTTAKGATQQPADSRINELNALLEEASKAPGVAEVMALSNRHQATLAQMSAYLGQRTRITITTTNATGW